MSAPTQSSIAAQNLSPQTGNQTGFYLWVGVDPRRTPEDQKPVANSQIIEIAETLGELVRELLPHAETHTTLSLAPDKPNLKSTTLEPVNSRPQRATTYAQQHSMSRRSYEQQTKEIEINKVVHTVPRTLPRPELPDFEFALRPRVTIDLHTRQVIADDLLQSLTYKEFELLAHLVTANGLVVSREELFRTVWAGEPSQDSRTIDVHVRRLREKLGLENHIITVRGRGYKFALTDQIDVIEAVSRRELS